MGELSEVASTMYQTDPKLRGTKSNLWLAELNMAFQLGDWNSPDDVLSEAMEALLAKHPALRQEVAVELYQQDLVSLSRAAEIAEMNRWSFEDLLRAKQIEIVNKPNTAEEIAEVLNTLRSTPTS